MKSKNNDGSVFVSAKERLMKDCDFFYDDLQSSKGSALMTLKGNIQHEFESLEQDHEKIMGKKDNEIKVLKLLLKSEQMSKIELRQKIKDKLFHNTPMTKDRIDKIVDEA